LEEKKMTDRLIYAQLSGRVYDRKDKNRMDIPDDWDEQTWLPDDSITGFSAGSYRKGNEVVIAFAGTNEIFKDFSVANIPAVLGLSSAQLTQAMTFTMNVMRNNPGSNISFTGHSLGGGLASVMAVFFDLPATIFDPAPFQLSAVNPLVLGSLQAYLSTTGYSNSAFDEYCQSLGFLFTQREEKVISYHLDGEILEPFRSGVTTIVGSEHEISIGNPTAGGMVLHSMSLLHAVMLSSEFASGVTQQRRAIEVFFDESLYARDPQKSAEPDFINWVLKQQLAGKGTLNALAKDLLKIDKIGTAGTEKINLGVLAALAEYYRYSEEPGEGFIESIDGGIKLDFSRIDNSSDKKGQDKLLSQSKEWLSSQGIDVRSLKKIDRVLLQSGHGALLADAGDDNKNYLIIGASQGDELIGGGGNDFLFGNSGSDTLIGNAGDDTLIGGEGVDRLEGGEGFDKYFVDNQDTIEDSDGSGSVTLYDMKLGVATRKKGETEYRDKRGNVFLYDEANKHLTVNGGLQIENYSNGDLGIILDEESDDPGNPGNPGNPNDPIEPIRDGMGQAAGIPSPIMLDLDGDGVETTSMGNGIYFDYAADGFAEKTAWVGKDDGLLVRDLTCRSMKW
jgi:hypothetical protein